MTMVGKARRESKILLVQVQVLIVPDPHGTRSKPSCLHAWVLYITDDVSGYMLW